MKKQQNLKKKAYKRIKKGKNNIEAKAYKKLKKIFEQPIQKTKKMHNKQFFQHLLVFLICPTLNSHQTQTK